MPKKKRLLAVLIFLPLLMASLFVPFEPWIVQKVSAISVADFLGDGPYTYTSFVAKGTETGSNCAAGEECLGIQGEAEVVAAYAGNGDGQGNTVLFLAGSNRIIVKKDEIGKGYADSFGQNAFDITGGISTARSFLGIAAPETPEEEVGDESEASALPNEGEWRDQTTIKYNNKYFRDNDIYNGENIFEQVDGDCKSTIKVIDVFAKGDEGELTYKEGNGCETKATKVITLNKPNYRVINGYRMNWGQEDQMIFMPQYKDCTTNGTTSGCRTATMGFFKRHPEGDPKRRDDIYWQWAGVNGFIFPCDDQGPEDTHVWVDLNEDNYDSVNGGHRQRTNNKSCRGTLDTQLFLAESSIQPPTDVYGSIDLANATVEGANGNPGGTSLGDNGGTITDGEEAAPTCESESKSAFGWLLCGALNMIDGVLGDGNSGLLGMVDKLLSVDSDMYQSEGLIKAWSYFKNLATFLLILVGLTMIIGQAISKE